MGPHNTGSFEILQYPIFYKTLSLIFIHYDTAYMISEQKQLSAYKLFITETITNKLTLIYLVC